MLLLSVLASWPLTREKWQPVLTEDIAHCRSCIAAVLLECLVKAINNSGASSPDEHCAIPMVLGNADTFASGIGDLFG